MAPKPTLTDLNRAWNSLDRSEKAERVRQLLGAGCRQQEIADAVGESRHVIFRLSKMAPTAAAAAPPRPKPALRELPPPAPKDPPSEIHDRDNHSWNITLNRTRITTLEQLVEYCKIDLEVWEVERWVCNKWEVGAAQKARSVRMTNGGGDEYIGWERGEDTSIVVEPLFQIKAWLKKRVDVATAKNVIRDLIADAKRFAPAYLPIPHKRTSSGITIELSIPDLHLGKLSWGKETGGPDWDSKITRDTFFRALQNLLTGLRGYNADKFWFIIGNDFYNADNKQGLTTKGTPQSTDTRYPKMFRTGRQMIVEATDTLTRTADTDLIIVPGNHDELSCFHLGENLEIWYANNPNVTVDNAPTLRKYRKFGQVGLMWTHGSNEKHDKLPLLMATEQRKMWGDTRYNEIHIGHFHGNKVDEVNGVRVRRLSALCPPDEWHSRNGYIGNLRTAEAFVWDRDRGLIGTAVYNEPDEDDATAAA